MSLPHNPDIEKLQTSYRLFEECPDLFEAFDHYHKCVIGGTWNEPFMALWADFVERYNRKMKRPYTTVKAMPGHFLVDTLHPRFVEKLHYDVMKQKVRIRPFIGTVGFKIIVAVFEHFRACQPERWNATKANILQKAEDNIIVIAETFGYRLEEKTSGSGLDTLTDQLGL